LCPLPLLAHTERSGHTKNKNQKHQVIIVQDW
jgi:hypothetical protein